MWVRGSLPPERTPCTLTRARLDFPSPGQEVQQTSMTSQASRRLSDLSEEIASEKVHLARLRDRLEAQRALLEEHRLRMLIAETPLADRELQRAAEAFLRIDGEVRDLEAAIEALHGEERGLARRLAGAGA